MAFESYPHTSNVTYDEAGNPIYDRAVNAEFLRHFYQKDRSNGVLMLKDSRALQVSAITNTRTVRIRSGYCFIQGAYGINHEDTIRQIDAAEPNLGRYDTIVLRLNDNVEFRNIDVYVKKGTPAENPQRPALQRDELIYELGIADIYIPPASSYVEQQYIEDTRLYPGRCGLSYPLQEIDTTNLALQYQAQLQSNVELIRAALDDVEAIHLQSEIDNIINNLIYPVNSVYLTFENRCRPAEFITDSTWEKMSDEAVLRFANNINTGGVDQYVKTSGICSLDSNGAIVRHGIDPSNPAIARWLTEVMGDTGWISSELYENTHTEGLADIPSAIFNSTHQFTASIGGNRSWWEQTHNNLPKYQNLFGFRRLS